MVKKALAFLFCSLGLIMMFRFFSHTWIGFFLGIAACGLGVVMFFFSGGNDPSTKMIERLRQQGIPLTVNLGDCVIKESHSLSEFNDLPFTPAQTTASALHESRDPESLESPLFRSVVQYHSEYKGKPVIFASPILPFEREYLLERFSQQKTSTIYIHRRHPSLYFFDLDFIYTTPSV